ncbi:hypothetical protein [Psychrosphaera algicola]|uniref:hypothetical protein n=1 Tax=Psychrosphaera algicola TaxID=3023714 RepID=UPI00351D8D44
MIGLARNLDINTVGHGVEVESTIHQLRDTQCRLAQGYFYSKPFELSGFETLARAVAKYRSITSQIALILTIIFLLISLLY